MACIGHEATGKIFCSGGYDPNHSNIVMSTILAYSPGSPPLDYGGTWAILTGNATSHHPNMT